MKYTLLVQCEHSDHPVLEIPLPLRGAETIDEAKARFHDAITVAKHKQADFHGRVCISPSKIDGVPTAEEEERHRIFLAITSSK